MEVENGTITISEQEDDSGLMSVSLVADRDSDNAVPRASGGSQLKKVTLCDLCDLLFKNDFCVFLP